MPKFIVVESQMVARRVEFKYNVEAESEAAAIDKVRSGTIEGEAKFPERNEVGDEEYGTAGYAACDFDTGDEEETATAAWKRMEKAEVLGLSSLATDHEDDDEGADPNEFRR